MKFVSNIEKTGEQEARCTYLQRQLTHLEKYVHDKFTIQWPILIFGRGSGDERKRKGRRRGRESEVIDLLHAHTEGVPLSVTSQPVQEKPWQCRASS